MRRSALVLAAILAFGLCAARACDDRVVSFVRQHSTEEVFAAARKVAIQVIKREVIVWPAPLSEMKPIRGYRNSVNLVVVLKEDGEKEFGMYIVLPESSYLPVPDDEWTFTGMGPISIYERKIGHNQRPEGTPAKSPSSDPSQVPGAPHP